MDIFQALVLGIVQGLTEFLPVSSTAHLVFVPWLFGWTDPAITSVQFDVALHMGTLLAVLVYFARDWRNLIVGMLKSLQTRNLEGNLDGKLGWMILLAAIPAGIVGLLGESKIDDLFHQPQNLRPGIAIIGVMLIVMAGVLFLAERIGKHAVQLQGVQLPTALGIGFAQALALIPGVSRSGSTITAGLFFGLTREAAARFSFLLATPVILGAGLKKVYDALKEGGIASSQQLGFAVGFLAASISGFLCIYFLLRFLQRNSTAPFIWYRIMAGLILLGLLAIGFRS